MKKRIVVLCDGTWKDPDDADHGHAAVTNVVKLWTAIAPAGTDGTPQIVIYDAGVGTGTNPSHLTPDFLHRVPWIGDSILELSKKVAERKDKVLGGAFGVGLSHNIEDVYSRLVPQWEPGDELFLFGFSRGAYTVRSLAGLIRNCGILKKENADRIHEAFKIYKSDAPADEPGGDNAQDFINRYSRPVDHISFIGVWDTVGSLGIPDTILQKAVIAESARRDITKHYSFHDVTLSSIVDTACHALAIDERRDPFKPTLWQLPEGDDNPGRVKQVWFTGVHSDVGGGYADPHHEIHPETDRSPLLSYITSPATPPAKGEFPSYGLSDITLLWMASRAKERGLKLTFGAPRLVLDPEPTAFLNDSFHHPYDVVGPYLRPVLKGVRTNEAIHESVRLRRTSRPDYAPANLAEYFAPGAEPLFERSDALWSEAGASKP